MLLFLALLPVILAESFWMTVELLRVDWREGCLTTAGCSHPKFEILEDMLPLKERISISWPVSEDFVQESSRPFVSHWAKGIPEDLALSCKVVGTDPTYGFPRICDQTASIRVFEDKASGRYRRDQVAATTSTPKEKLGKKLVELRAKCFTAVLAVQKHTEKCPWCPDPTEVTLIEQKLTEDVPSTVSTSKFMRLLGDDNVMSLSMMVLAGIAVISSLGIAFVLVAFLRLKRNDCEFSSKASPQPRSRPNLVKIPIRSNAPWEQTRPLTYWLSSSSKSKATTTSPIDSASSIGTRSSVVIPSFRSGYLDARHAVDNGKPRLKLTWKTSSDLMETPNQNKHANAFDTILPAETRCSRRGSPSNEGRLRNLSHFASGLC